MIGGDGHDIYIENAIKIWIYYIRDSIEWDEPKRTANICVVNAGLIRV
jgi:hypothetical protein